MNVVFQNMSADHFSLFLNCVLIYFPHIFDCTKLLLLLPCVLNCICPTFYLAKIHLSNDLVKVNSVLILLKKIYIKVIG